jgi:cyclopropane fatty-acyl-phospholipid synthase-like methyltransferase
MMRRKHLTSAASFARLAITYRWLEWIAFGRTLERARNEYLPLLGDARSLLILGEGDGRHLCDVLTAAPLAHVRSIDSSTGMLSNAARRVAALGMEERVHFEHADVRTAAYPRGAYDAVLTPFVLDCFRSDEVKAIVGLVSASLRPGAYWLLTDFVLPAGWGARLHARAWLAVLYPFFRWQTRIEARTLPSSEAILQAHGLVCVAARDRRWGFVRSTLWTYDPTPSSHATGV